MTSGEIQQSVYFLRARYNSSVYFRARYSSWVYMTFGETEFLFIIVVPITPNFGSDGPSSSSWADAMLSLALFSNKPWRWNRMSSFCKAKYKICNHEAACWMCRRLFTGAKGSTTGEVDASVSKYTEWKHEQRIQQLARLPRNFWGVIFGRDATVCIYNRWVRRLRA